MSTEASRKYQREYKRRYRIKHPELARAAGRKFGRIGYLRLKQQVLDILGGQCARCGFDDPRALQIDHINGGGTKEIHKIGSPRISRRIRAGHTDGYQLLCANCNWIKRHENHETKRRLEDG